LRKTPKKKLWDEEIFLVGKRGHRWNSGGRHTIWQWECHSSWGKDWRGSMLVEWYFLESFSMHINGYSWHFLKGPKLLDQTCFVNSKDHEAEAHTQAYYI
jgi:hypothetical protein